MRLAMIAVVMTGLCAASATGQPVPRQREYLGDRLPLDDDGRRYLIDMAAERVGSAARVIVLARRCGLRSINWNTYMGRRLEAAGREEARRLASDAEWAAYAAGALAAALRTGGSAAAAEAGGNTVEACRHLQAQPQALLDLDDGILDDVAQNSRR